MSKYMKHPELTAVIEVPDSAVPIYRQSNWDVLTEQEIDDLHAKQQDELRAVENAMADSARTTPASRPPLDPEQPPTPPEPEQSRPASARHKSGSSKENT